MIESPCKGCKQRHKHCHAECPDYIEYAEACEAARAVMRATQEPYNAGRIRNMSKNAKHKWSEHKDSDL